MSLGHFPLAPNFGAGVYRRLVRLRSTPSSVLATVDDTHHAMWLLLRHDGLHVLAVDAGIERGPATTCGGAPAALSRIVGAALDASEKDVTALLPPIANCTHLGDLLRWSMARAREGKVGSTEFRISVPDAKDDGVWLEISRDDATIHRWYVRDLMIVLPVHLAGRPLLRGFFGWARETFDEADLEAAVMLQRGAWVARGRRYVVDASPLPLQLAEDMKDACHSYSGDSWTVATNHVGYVRDFTSGVVEQGAPGWVQSVLREDEDGTARRN